MRLDENKKSLLFIVGFIIVTRLPVVFLYSINTLNNIPPVVTITSPSENAYISGTITIEFTATDQQGVIKERQILIDNVIIDYGPFEPVPFTTTSRLTTTTVLTTTGTTESSSTSTVSNTTNSISNILVVFMALGTIVFFTRKSRLS